MYYRTIFEKNFEFLTKGDKFNASDFIKAMMELRKFCIYPYLLKEKIVVDYLKERITVRAYPSLINSDFIL
jgi:chromodomain-helicase-DNA-binding protein 7